ncbi:alpha/beta fold hydrolase [Brevundimonas sp.]|uniref:alpha/beta fold hydrolase n=1 Tax=Brevundimonas sp. TaxID=1871086 RepID=UPI002632C1E4|nr:alpha/beta fold hydrolase [Brevundimonas sp.]
MALAVPVKASSLAVPQGSTPLRQFSRFTTGRANPRVASVFYDVLEPASGPTRSAIVMVHGGAHTGGCYLSTPDGRPGWARYFASQGHRVFVPDWPGMGRSGGVALDELGGQAVCTGLSNVIEAAGEPVILMTHSMAGAFGWQLVESCGSRILKVVAIAPAPPGNIQPAARVLERGEGFIVVEQPTGPYRVNLQSMAMPDLGWARRKLIGSGGRFPIETADRYLASLAATPPLLVLERVNADSRQLKVNDFANFRGKRMLIVIGTSDPDHTETTDEPTVRWLNQNGARAEMLRLASLGIEGNGHMMMLENNSDEVAAHLAAWMSDE